MFYYSRKLKKKISDSDTEVDPALIALHNREMEKLKKFRAQLSRKTREVEKLKRIIDSIPDRAEIAQYQKRFLELYNLGN